MLSSMLSRQTAALLVAAALCACGNEKPRGQVRIRPPGDAAVPAERLAAPSDPLSEASLAADLEWLTADARKGRGSRSAEAIEVARWIAGELEQAGYAVTLQPIPAVDGQLNVLAVYGPREESAPTVLVSAHYDHLGEVDGQVHPGADDNASGVAVALAVARDLAARRDVAGRVVFAFFGAEEPGLLGAYAYAAKPLHPLADTRAVFNLDMVGRKFFESTVGADATLGSVGLPDDAALLEAAEAAAADAGLELIAVSPALVALVGEDWRSDDWVFRDKGVPAVHFSTGIHDDYHKPTDTLDRLSRPQMVRIARFLRALVARTAGGDR
jgi:Zn-dependent M28 family amino/carboxypeptidase